MKFGKWKNIFTSFDLVTFLQAKETLKKHKINFKEKTIDNNLRIAMNTVGTRTDTGAGRTSSVKNYYYIYVKEEDAEYASHLLEKHIMH